jgi:hypothetical protein
LLPFEAPLEAVDQVARVAWRLNRLGLQRATYRSVAAVLFAASVAAVSAAYLAPVWFRALFALLVVVWLTVLTASVIRLWSHWARPVEAARWVEDRVGLEDRLLTLVTAPADARGSRLWPELLQDNQVHLPRWKDARLDIPTVPWSLGALVIAAALAAIFLVPWGERELPPPLGIPSPSAFGPGALAEQVPGRDPPLPGNAVVHGGNGAAEDAEQDGTALAMAAIDRIQGELDERFRQSLGGQVMADEPDEAPSAEADEPTAGFRADAPEAGIGETESKPGGAQPAEGLARREDGATTGPAVKSLEPSGGGRGGAGGKGPRKARPAKSGGEEGAGKAGRTAKRGGTGDGPKAVADGKSESSAGAGGAGAGAGKATGPLFADAPLTLSGGRKAAQFTLTLGAAPGAGREGEEETEMLTLPQGHIAAGERGTQVADRNVRREEIPPEYEGIVKRVFERNR